MSLKQMQILDGAVAVKPEPVGVVGTDLGGTHLMYGSQYVGKTPDKKTAIFFKDVPIGAPLYTTPPAQLEHGSCGNCNGSGRMPRDPDIGTDQECFVCDGTGKLPKEPEQEPVAIADGTFNHNCPIGTPLYTKEQL